MKHAQEEAERDFELYRMDKRDRQLLHLILGSSLVGIVFMGSMFGWLLYQLIVGG